MIKYIIRKLFGVKWDLVIYCDCIYERRNNMTKLNRVMMLLLDQIFEVHVINKK